MRKWILIFVSLFIGGWSLQAQDQVSCRQLLEDAKEAYGAGMVEVVPDLLLPCLDQGALQGTSRQEAYKLVINAYLFDYLPDEADQMMDRFLTDFPGYRAQEGDPAEFVLLLESNLRERGIDPNQPLVIEEEQVPEQARPQQQARQQSVRPPFEYTNSIGFTLGANGTFPQMVERYSTGDPAEALGSFGFKPGFQVGGALNLLLGQAVEVSFGVQFNRTSFSYSDTPFEFTSYEYLEHQNRVQLPASFLFKLNPYSRRVSVYLRAGVMGEALISASGSGIRSYTENLKDVEVDGISVKDARTSLNLAGLAGLGVRIPLQKSFIFIETSYAYSIFLANKGENRYVNQDLTWLLYHVDSDFRLQQLSLTTGIAWNL